jgi:preprotein translocase subunit SecA
MGRVAALLRALTINPDVTLPQNTERLADLIGLDVAEHASLGEVLERGIPHRVLNAKYHEMEAHIIANAGRPGALTIATNMAGRGVDILLGGNPQEVARELLRKEGVEPEHASEEQFEASLAKAQDICAKDKEMVLGLGGLHILGTERHESRRIDNQLRGRSGRQGDPGSSRFYVSFQDELMRLFGPERLDFFLSKWPENEPIEARITSRMIENAQKKVEAHNFEIRKHRLQYDDIMNHQRALIYEQRRRVLMGEDLRESIFVHLREFVADRTKELASPEVHPEDWNLEALHQLLAEVYPIGVSAEQLREHGHHDDLLELLQDDITRAYDEREEAAGVEQLRELERLITLRVVSTRWIDHLASMEYLEEGIGLRGYSGVDPLVIYRKESYDYWQQLVATIREDTIRYLFRVEIEAQETEEQRRQRLGLGHAPEGQPVEVGDEDGMATAAAATSAEAPAATAVKAPPRRETSSRRAPKRAGPKVGRNAPCPCGSGRKYKKCCGQKAS